MQSDVQLFHTCMNKEIIMENYQNYKIGTKCVQAGYTPGNGEPRQIPIVQSTTFKYSTSEDMGKLFDLEASGYFYSRLQNPTNDLVAAKIAAMEGGAAAMLTSSGQAANFLAMFFLNLWRHLQSDRCHTGKNGHHRYFCLPGCHGRRIKRSLPSKHKADVW